MTTKEINLDKEYLNSEEISQLTGISVNSLAVLRSKKEKFPFYKIGRKVYYKKAEILSIIESGKVEIQGVQTNGSI